MRAVAATADPARRICQDCPVRDDCLLLPVTRLIIGIITPAQLGHWDQTGAGWVVDTGHTITS